MTLGDLFDREKDAGKVEGKIEGKIEGRSEESIELILIKMRKNYSVSQIAADIEKQKNTFRKFTIS